MKGRGRIKRIFPSVVPDSPIGVLHESARASETSGSTSGDARRRLGVDAGGERRILFEDAAMARCCEFPSLLEGSVTLPWAASHSFVDLRT